VKLSELRDDLFKSDRHADRVVPPSGHTAWLTSVTSAAMAFLAVFALAVFFLNTDMRPPKSDAKPLVIAHVLGLAGQRESALSGSRRIALPL